MEIAGHTMIGSVLRKNSVVVECFDVLSEVGQGDLDGVLQVQGPELRSYLSTYLSECPVVLSELLWPVKLDP